MRKQLKLVNWGTLVRVLDDMGAVYFGKCDEILKDNSDLGDSFVKDVKVDKIDGKPLLVIRVKNRAVNKVND